MKIRVFSDIHNEIRRSMMGRRYTPWVPAIRKEDSETVLVLAGDIDHAKQVPEYLNSLSERFLAVIHVSGNHEYYGSNLTSVARALRESELADNVHCLQNSSVTIRGQKFIGSTMWTNLQGREWAVSRAMNDYRYIRLGTKGNYRKLNPGDTTYLHNEAVQFIANNVDKDTIVVTHHSPLSPGNSSLGGFNPYGRQPSDVDYAYHACLENQIIEEWKPKAWISGHTHEAMDVEYFNTRLIVNCVGYLGEDSHYTEECFDVV